MSKQHITTQDLYCGAYFLTRGLKLENVNLIEGRDFRKSATFLFSGMKAEEVVQEYKCGQAVAPIGALKVALEYLKDEMFQHLRSEEKEA
jgi:hypothetical protein